MDCLKKENRFRPIFRFKMYNKKNTNWRYCINKKIQTLSIFEKKNSNIFEYFWNVFCHNFCYGQKSEQFEKKISKKELE